MHPLALHSLPGLDARRLRALEAAGVAHLEELVAAGPDQLAQLTQFDAKTCKALLRLAEGALDRERVTVIPLPETGGAKGRLGRGLESARRIERTHVLLRAVASRLPPSPRPRWRKRVRRARKQLHRLTERLSSLQQVLLAEGVSSAGEAHLRNVLDEVDANLRARAELPPCRRTFRRIARSARGGRKLLAG